MTYEFLPANRYVCTTHLLNLGGRSRVVTQSGKYVLSEGTLTTWQDASFTVAYDPLGKELSSVARHDREESVFRAGIEKPGEFQLTSEPYAVTKYRLTREP